MWNIECLMIKVCMVCIITMNSREIIKRLEADGWVKHTQKGSHCQYKHPTKKGKVTVPPPKKDLPKKTVVSILKQADLSGLQRG